VYTISSMEFKVICDRVWNDRHRLFRKSEPVDERAALLSELWKELCSHMSIERRLPLSFSESLEECLRVTIKLGLKQRKSPYFDESHAIDDLLSRLEKERSNTKDSVLATNI
jgi:hypothetical protein